MTAEASIEVPPQQSIGDRYRCDVAALGAAQKSSRGAPLYSLLINRPLGRRIAACAHLVGLRPNQVSIISWLVTVSGLAVFAFVTPTWPIAVLAAALLMLGYAIDAADGQLARLTTGGTIAGEWLDHVLDMVKIGAFHGAVLISADRHSDAIGRWTLGIALGFMIVATSSFFVLILTDLLRRKNELAAPPRPSTWWFVLLGLPTDYGIQCMWMATHANQRLFFAGYAILALANLGYLAIGAASRFRQLRAADVANGVVM